MVFVIYILWKTFQTYMCVIKSNYVLLPTKNIQLEKNL